MFKKKDIMKAKYEVKRIPVIRKVLLNRKIARKIYEFKKSDFGKYVHNNRKYDRFSTLIIRKLWLYKEIYKWFKDGINKGKIK